MRLTLLATIVLLAVACSSEPEATATPTATAEPTAAPTVEPAPAAPTVHLDPTFEVQVTEAVVYGKALVHGEWGATGTAVDLTLDVYEPIDDGDAPHPAIIVIHGGGFRSNHSQTGSFPGISEYFASRGWVAVSINYRLSQEHGTFPADWPEGRGAVYTATRDASAAVRWLRDRADHYDIDTERITALGASAGAIVALALGSADEGDYRDEITIGEDWTLATTRLHQSSRVATVIDLWGSLSALTPLEVLDGESRINEGDAAVLIIHGTEDSVVPFASGVEVRRAMAEAGVPVELVALEGIGHSKFAALANERPQNDVTFDFIVEHQGLEVR